MLRVLYLFSSHICEISGSILEEVFFFFFAEWVLRIVDAAEMGARVGRSVSPVHRSSFLLWTLLLLILWLTCVQGTWGPGVYKYQTGTALHKDLSKRYGFYDITEVTCSCQLKF